MENEANFMPNEFEGAKLRTDIPQVEIKDGPAPEDLPDVLWVDFDYGEDPEKGIKCAGMETYVISPVTEQNLFSDKYLNCTGTVGIGRDKASGKEIAFISHQDPEFFLNKGVEETKKFVTDMEVTLKDLFAKSEEGTVEVVLFGGNEDSEDSTSKKSVDYKKSIEMLEKIILESTGFRPSVLMGPNPTKSSPFCNTRPRMS